MSTATRLAGEGSEPSPTFLDKARAQADQRRVRTALFGTEALNDAAWHILLVLFIAHELAVAVSLAEICRQAGIPPATGSRWLDVLEERGWVAEYSDGTDCGGTLAGLTAAGMEGMLRYLDAL